MLALVGLMKIDAIVDDSDNGNITGNSQWRWMM